MSQAGLKIMEILKLLPMTNCKACGYATCMAYAAALREGEISLHDCPPLWERKYGRNGKSFRPTWKVSAGGLWTQINEKGFRCEHLFRPFPLLPVS